MHSLSGECCVIKLLSFLIFVCSSASFVVFVLFFCFGTHNQDLTKITPVRRRIYIASHALATASFRFQLPPFFIYFYAGRPWWCGQPVVLAGHDDVDSLLCWPALMMCIACCATSALMMWIACYAGQPWWCGQPVVLVSLACQPWHDDVVVGSWQDWIPLFRNLGVSVCYYETGDVDIEVSYDMSGCFMQPHLWFPFRIIMERGPHHGGCHCVKKASYFLFMI